jgi:hypothetical protein
MCARVCDFRGFGTAFNQYGMFSYPQPIFCLFTNAMVVFVVAKVWHCAYKIAYYHVASNGGI